VRSHRCYVGPSVAGLLAADEVGKGIRCVAVPRLLIVCNFTSSSLTRQYSYALNKHDSTFISIMLTRSFLLALFALTCSVSSSPVGGISFPDPCDGHHVDDPCVLLGIPIDGTCQKVEVSQRPGIRAKGNEKRLLLTKAACLLLQDYLICAALPATKECDGKKEGDTCELEYFRLKGECRKELVTVCQPQYSRLRSVVENSSADYDLSIDLERFDLRDCTCQAPNRSPPDFLGVNIAP